MMQAMPPRVPGISGTLGGQKQILNISAIATALWPKVARTDNQGSFLEVVIPSSNKATAPAVSAARELGGKDLAQWCVFAGDRLAQWAKNPFHQMSSPFCAVGQALTN